MFKYSYLDLEKTLRSNGDVTFDESTAKIAVGAAVPSSQFEDLFYKVAFDMYKLDPNVQIEDSYWRLSDDKKHFIKVYEGDAPEPHDHRWSVYPNDNGDKLSVSYKEEPITTLNLSDLNMSDADIRVAQRGLLKMLNTNDGVESLLSIVGSARKNYLEEKYPELRR